MQWPSKGGGGAMRAPRAALLEGGGKIEVMRKKQDGGKVF